MIAKSKEGFLRAAQSHFFRLIKRGIDPNSAAAESLVLAANNSPPAIDDIVTETSSDSCKSSDFGQDKKIGSKGSWFSNFRQNTGNSTPSQLDKNGDPLRASEMEGGVQSAFSGEPDEPQRGNVQLECDRFVDNPPVESMASAPSPKENLPAVSTSLPEEPSAGDTDTTVTPAVLVELTDLNERLQKERAQLTAVRQVQKKGERCRSRLRPRPTNSSQAASDMVGSQYGGTPRGDNPGQHEWEVCEFTAIRPAPVRDMCGPRWRLAEARILDRRVEQHSSSGNSIFSAVAVGGEGK